MAPAAQKIDVFISYKREDRAKAEAIAERLTRLGYRSWWDIDLLPGDMFSKEIGEIIKRAETAIVLWSKLSVNSPFVLDEAGRARDRGVLIPVQLDDCELPLGFGALHTLDLRSWTGGSNDRRLNPLITAIKKRATPSHKPATSQAPSPEAELAEEVVEWRKLRDRAKTSAKDYEDYLARFGKVGIFSQLAEQTILAKEKEKEKSPASVPPWLAIAGAGVAALAGISVIVLNWLAILETLGLREKIVDAKPFSELSVCSGDWLFRQRANCEDKSKPIYGIVTDAKVCGVLEITSTTSLDGFKECRDITHGVERYANSEVVSQNSGRLGGGRNQAWWCQEMMNRYSAAHPSVEIVWTGVTQNPESKGKTWDGHAWYNYSCTATAQWNPIYNAKATVACGRLDPVTKTEAIPKTCEDRSKVTGYATSRNASCAWDSFLVDAQGAKVKPLYAKYEQDLVDLPRCSTCDEFAGNADQRGLCLAGQVSRLRNSKLADPASEPRIYSDMADVARQLLGSGRYLSPGTRKEFARQFDLGS